MLPYTQLLIQGRVSSGQEGYLVSDGRFFQSSWGQGLEQDEVAVYYVRRFCGPCTTRR